MLQKFTELWEKLDFICKDDIDVLKQEQLVPLHLLVRFTALSKGRITLRAIEDRCLESCGRAFDACRDDLQVQAQLSF